MSDGVCLHTPDAAKSSVEQEQPMSETIKDVSKIYSDGHHNYCVGNMVVWKDDYYLCFVDATVHGAEDGQVRIMRSADLENWTTQVAVGPTSFDPQLLAAGDELFVYAVTAEHLDSDENGFPSHQVLASTGDGVAWSTPKPCFLRNHDFWRPVAHESRFYVACDNCGHIPGSEIGSVYLLCSDDGLRWSVLSEIVRGTEYYGRLPSEAAICFLDDETLLSVVRTKSRRTVIARSKPPYEQWDRQIIDLVFQGPTLAKAGESVVATGRCKDDEGRARTGIFLCEDDDLRLHVLLPSGGDTGYAGIYGESDKEVLIAYYSSHEYSIKPEECIHVPSDIYLARVSLD
jgi:hypothetical protein